MWKVLPERTCAPRLSRRRFVQGIAGGAVLLTPLCGFLREAGVPNRAVLTGPEFDLTIGDIAVNYTGRSRTATAVNDQVPGPLLRMRQGDTVTIRVTNRLPVRSSIHWHGLIVPADMDGVPGVSFVRAEGLRQGRPGATHRSGLLGAAIRAPVAV